MIPPSQRQADDYCTRQHVCHYMLIRPANFVRGICGNITTDKESIAL
jgi:hypothetical protein